jgi:hypothetical protein
LVMFGLNTYFISARHPGIGCGGQKHSWRFFYMVRKQFDLPWTTGFPGWTQRLPKQLCSVMGKETIRRARWLRVFQLHSWQHT